MKCYPPLTKLPSFLVNGKILAYLGYDHEVKELLLLLSHNAMRYFWAHSTILDNMLVREPSFLILPQIMDIAKEREPTVCIVEELESKASAINVYVAVSNKMDEIGSSMNKQ